MEYIKLDTNPDNINYAFKAVISNLYSTPFFSSVREILSNAYDAALKNINKVDIHIDTYSVYESQHYISIRDYGLGISETEMRELYGVAFKSSKREDHTQIGSFGIGRFAPLSYLSSFQLQTWVDGYHYTYTVGFDDEAPYYSLEDKQPSTDLTGTKIILPIPTTTKRWQLNCFVHHNSMFLKEVDVAIHEKYNEPSKPTNITKLSEIYSNKIDCTKQQDCKFTSNTSYQVFDSGAISIKKQFAEYVAVVSGGIYYALDNNFEDIFRPRNKNEDDPQKKHFEGLNPILPAYTSGLRSESDIQELSLQFANIILFISPKDLDFPTNRETIAFTSKSYNTIKKAYLALGRDFVKYNHYNFTSHGSYGFFVNNFHSIFSSFLISIKNVKYKDSEINILRQRTTQSDSWLFDNTLSSDSENLINNLYYIPVTFQTTPSSNSSGSVYYANPDFSELPSIIEKLSTGKLDHSEFTEGADISKYGRSFNRMLFANLEELEGLNFIFFKGKRKVKASTLLGKIGIDSDNWHGFIVRYEDDDFNLDNFKHLKTLSEKGVINLLDAGDLRKKKNVKKKDKPKGIYSVLASKRIYLIRDKENKGTLYANKLSLPEKFFYVTDRDYGCFLKYYSSQFVMNKDVYVIPEKYLDQLNEDCEHGMECIKYSIEKLKENFLKAYSIEHFDSSITQVIFSLIQHRTLSRKNKDIIRLFVDVLKDSKSYSPRKDYDSLIQAFKDACMFESFHLLSSSETLSSKLNLDTEEKRYDFRCLINSGIGISEKNDISFVKIIDTLDYIFGKLTVDKVYKFMRLVYYNVDIKDNYTENSVKEIAEKLLES